MKVKDTQTALPHENEDDNGCNDHAWEDEPRDLSMLCRGSRGIRGSRDCSHLIQLPNAISHTKYHRFISTINGTLSSDAYFDNARENRFIDFDGFLESS